MSDSDAAPDLDLITTEELLTELKKRSEGIILGIVQKCATNKIRYVSYGAGLVQLGLLNRLDRLVNLGADVHMKKEEVDGELS